MMRLQEILQEFKGKVSSGTPQWRNKKKVEARYEEACAKLHIPSDVYSFELYEHKGGLRLSCKKNYYRIGRHIDRFGKNIIITDNKDWETNEKVNASQDRRTVGDGFRKSKDDDLVAMMPVRHWTDSKIRCHIFTCVASLALLRLVELRLRRAGLQLTAKAAMKQLHRLIPVLYGSQGEKSQNE